MAIDLATGFNIGSKDAIDERQVLTLEQMKNLDESIYPDKYFAICKDNGKLYLYDVNNGINNETGKFRKVSSNESVDPSIFQKINDDTLITEDKTIVGAINELKTGVSSISVPTRVSQLTNDSGYITSDEVDLIKEYNPDETYNEGQICLYNNYVWLCTTVTTGTFEESNWEKQTDNITELDLNTIKTFLGLTPEQLETMADIISSEIRTDKVFSSSETYTRIDNALKEAKQYCITQLAQKSTSNFKIATSVSEVTDENYLYLIMNDVSSKYDIYALIDGTVEKLTNIEVNLDNYFTKSEIEADFLKKTDADGKYVTITAVEGKVDKTDILKAKSDTATDEKIYSAKSINSQLNEMKQNFQDGVDTVYDAVVAKGTTPVDKTPSEIAIAISKLGGELTSIYNALITQGLPMTGEESENQIAAIITDLMTINVTTKTYSNTFVFNGTKEIIKETELVDTSSGLILEFNSEELTSVESGDYIEFAEIDKTEYNNKIKFM